MEEYFCCKGTAVDSKALHFCFTLTVVWWFCFFFCRNFFFFFTGNRNINASMQAYRSRGIYEVFMLLPSFVTFLFLELVWMELWVHSLNTVLQTLSLLETSLAFLSLFLCTSFVEVQGVQIHSCLDYAAEFSQTVINFFVYKVLDYVCLHIHCDITVVFVIGYLLFKCLFTVTPNLKSNRIFTEIWYLILSILLNLYAEQKTCRYLTEQFLYLK